MFPIWLVLEHRREKTDTKKTRTGSERASRGQGNGPRTARRGKCARRNPERTRQKCRDVRRKGGEQENASIGQYRSSDSDQHRLCIHMKRWKRVAKFCCTALVWNDRRVPGGAWVRGKSVAKSLSRTRGLGTNGVSWISLYLLVVCRASTSAATHGLQEDPASRTEEYTGRFGDERFREHVVYLCRRGSVQACAQRVVNTNKEMTAHAG